MPLCFLVPSLAEVSWTSYPRVPKAWQPHPLFSVPLPGARAASSGGFDPLVMEVEPLSFCLIAESFLFWFFRATHEVQPSHEWERYHLRPAHPAVSSKGSSAGGPVPGAGWSFSPCLLRGILFILRRNGPASALSSLPFPLR